MKPCQKLIKTPPPKTAPIPFVNISPAEPDFSVYEEGELHLCSS